MGILVNWQQVILLQEELETSALNQGMMEAMELAIAG